MSEFCCKNCGPNITVVFKNVGPHRGAYCNNCGKWIKWVSQKDFRDKIEKNRVSNMTSVNSDNTNIDNTMLDAVLDDKEPW